MNDFYVLRDKRTGSYVAFGDFGFLYAVSIRTDATRFTRESADMLIEDGIVPRVCDDWPIMKQPLDLECVYVPDLNEAQMELPL